MLHSHKYIYKKKTTNRVILIKVSDLKEKYL